LDHEYKFASRWTKAEMQIQAGNRTYNESKHLLTVNCITLVAECSLIQTHSLTLAFTS